LQVPQLRQLQSCLLGWSVPGLGSLPPWADPSAGARSRSQLAFDLEGFFTPTWARRPLPTARPASPRTYSPGSDRNHGRLTSYLQRPLGPSRTRTLGRWRSGRDPAPCNLLAIANTMPRAVDSPGPPRRSSDGVQPRGPPHDDGPQGLARHPRRPG